MTTNVVGSKVTPSIVVLLVKDSLNDCSASSGVGTSVLSLLNWSSASTTRLPSRKPRILTPINIAPYCCLYITVIWERNEKYNRLVLKAMNIENVCHRNCLYLSYIRMSDYIRL